jgi:RNA polymerase sigma-70 factor (ECF subfamily)
MTAAVVKANIMAESIELNKEEELVRRCQSGDEEAIKMLYSEQAGRLFTLALRLTGDRAEAEEVVQDGFLKAWRNIGGFRSDSSIGSWLYRITVNLCRDRARKQRDLNQPGEIGVLPSMPDTFARQRLKSALTRLSEGYREVLVMHDVMEMRHPEIADVLGIKVGTSKSQLHKARAHMRRLLKEENVHQYI